LPPKHGKITMRRLEGRARARHGMEAEWAYLLGNEDVSY
jgi:hypothetical protein